LKIAGISSRKMGDAREGQLNNPYQYQGDYSEFDDETGWNDFALRSYDPQTGRFINADPYDQFASGYVGMGNDPINNTDPSGGFSVNFGSITTLGRIGVAAGGAAVGFVIDKLSGGNGWAGAAIGGGLALGATFINPFDIGGFTNAVSDVSALSIVSTGIRTVSFGIDVAEEDNQGVRYDIYDIEEETRELIKRGEFIEAINGMMKYYEDELSNKNLIKWVVDKEQGGHVTWSVGDGKSKTSFGENVLKQFGWGLISFGYLTRSIYHEIGGHVMTNSGENVDHVGWDGESEVVAYTKQYLNTTLPKFDVTKKVEKENIKNDKKNLEKYYNQMPQEGKDYYKSNFDKAKENMDELLNK
jgi:RHS repeat-associated protein